MIYLNAFLVGGTICLIGQLLIDGLKLIPVKVACIFVVSGAVLKINDIYKILIDFAGAGALLPISSFGYSMTNAVVEFGINEGLLGILKGSLTSTSVGISYAVILAIIMALLFKPKG